MLVVSRTPELLNRMLHRLNSARHSKATTIEVIVSWNGSTKDEAHIDAGRLLLKLFNRILITLPAA